MRVRAGGGGLKYCDWQRARVELTASTISFLPKLVRLLSKGSGIYIEASAENIEYNLGENVMTKLQIVYLSQNPCQAPDKAYI